MGIFASGMLFVILVLVYIVIAEVFTVLFRFTGLPEEKARFQVISLLTNSGFTTQESEIITSTPARRKLARYTMFFGYAFTVTIVSALVNIFMALKASELANILWGLPLPALVLATFFLLQKNKTVRHATNHAVEAMAHRIMFHSETNQVLLMDVIGSRVIAQVHLAQVPDRLKNIPMKENHLRDDYDVLAMLVKHENSKEVLTVDGDTVFLDGDTIVACGLYEQLHAAFCENIHMSPDVLKT